MALRTSRQLSTGCPILDHTLGGGIETQHGIVEIAGQSGAGKSQLVLQLLLRAQLPIEHGGLAGGAVLLHTGTESAITNRLTQLALEFSAEYAHLGASVDRLLDHVTLCKMHSADLLWGTLSEHLPQLLSTTQIRLLVIDSFGALFRPLVEGGGVSLAAERSTQLCAHAHRLKQLSDDFGLAVIVTNEVTDKPRGVLKEEGLLPPPLQESSVDTTTSPFELAASYGSDSVTLPALGLVWSSFVNTRILITRTEMALAPLAPPAWPELSTALVNGRCDGVGGERNIKGYGEGRLTSDADGRAPLMQAQRRLHIVLSPTLPPRSCDFEIRQEGVRGKASTIVADNR